MTEQVAIIVLEQVLSIKKYVQYVKVQVRLQQISIYQKVKKNIFLKKPQGVGTARMNQVLLVFLEVTAAAVVITTSLAATVTVGVLQSSLQALLGPTAWTTTMAMPSGLTAIRRAGFLSGASGINSVLALTI